MFVGLAFVLLLLVAIFLTSTSLGQEFAPTVTIALLVRNKAHALPYVLAALEQQDYPTDRVSLWIREDNSVDESARLLESWRRAHLSKAQPLFHSIDLETSSKTELLVDIDDYVLPEWTDERFSHVMKLRQLALDAARRAWSDRLFLMDADVVLTNKAALLHLVESSGSMVVVAPLLNCTGGVHNSASYANFWGAIDASTGYYKRSDDYFEIRRREKLGLFEVPMVHTALMINLRHVDSVKVKFEKPDLNEKYSGPYDDIIVFALRSKQNGLKLLVDNRIFFGYFTEPLSSGFYLNNEREYFRHLLMEAMLEQVDLALNGSPAYDATSAPIDSLAASAFLDPQWSKPPAVQRYGFDRIYFINLARRVDRRRKMEFSFNLLGIEAEYFEAVDGKLLNVSYLSNLGVRQMPGYSDPYYRRGLKLGEVGCFLSHMQIWQELANNPDLQKVIIFEDDIRFHAMFDSIFRVALSEAENLRLDWELLYLGRKILLTNETMLPKARYLALPGYTYWTLSYAITKHGAQKLLAQQPLTRMVAVDEFLPIMFDKHPQADWKSYFEPRDLIALTLAPLIVEPTHYVGAKHYFSDTEASVVLCNDSDGVVNAVDSTLELCGKHKLDLSGRAFQTDSSASKQEL